MQPESLPKRIGTDRLVPGVAIYALAMFIASTPCCPTDAQESSRRELAGRTDDRFPSASSESRPQLPETTVTRQTFFSIPFFLNPRSTQPNRVLLFVSHDRGRTWTLYETRQPQEQRFGFQASRDGEYWFVVRTDLDRRAPDEQTRPEKIVVIDREKPELELRVSRGVTGELSAEWRASDPHLDPRSLRIQYRSDQDDAWQPVSLSGREGAPLPDRALSAAASGLDTGRTIWAPSMQQGSLLVQASVFDRAGNSEAIEQRVLMDPPHSQQLPAAGVTPPDTPFSPSDIAADRNAFEDAATYESAALRTETQRLQTNDSVRETVEAQPSYDWSRAGAWDRASEQTFSSDAANPNWDGARPAESGRTGAPPSGDPATAPSFQDALGTDDRSSQPTRRANDWSSPEYTPLEPAVSNRFGADGLPDNRVTGTSLPDGDSSWDASEQRHHGSFPAESADQRDETHSVPREPGSDSFSREEIPVTNSRAFELEYDIQDLGPGQVSRVVLWYTMNNGLTWRIFGTDSDRKSPFLVEIEGEGVYGFSLLVYDDLGQSGRPPQPGDPPDQSIRVDLTPPRAKLTQVDVQGEGSDARVVVTWQAEDDALGPFPVQLFSAPTPEGPWLELTQPLPNTGSYTWRPNRMLSPQTYLQLRVTDQAGNTATDQMFEPLGRIGREPVGVIRGLRPLPPTR